MPTDGGGARRCARVFAAAGLLISLLAGLAGGAEVVSDRQAIHVLNRLAFGPTQEEFDLVKTVGVERYIAAQLDPGSIAEPIELRWRLAQLDTLKLNPVQLRQLYGPLRAARLQAFAADRQAQRERVRMILRDAGEARILRAVISRRQLQEVMVDFWFNHFNVFSGKGLDDIWIGNYESQAIRPFALGRFRDLLFATAKHPAMLVYLDNSMSSAPGSPGARGNKAGLNENFAREVMELHTLGADGGYTQEDVVTLARILTGWGVNRADARVSPDHAAVFEGARHDYGPKVFLGHPMGLAARPRRGGARYPRAQPGNRPPHRLQARPVFRRRRSAPCPCRAARRRFLATDGDIREIAEDIVRQPEFWDSPGRKYKTPYQFVTSAVRAAGLPVANVRPLLGAMEQLGMPLFGCLTPDGYKNTEEAWLSPDATMRRISFATALARGELPVRR